MSDNPIHQLLDAAGVPWRDTRASLARRYGIQRHPAYDWEAIEVATPRPILEGLLWPLTVSVRDLFSPHLPATHFWADTRFFDRMASGTRSRRPAQPST